MAHPLGRRDEELRALRTVLAETERYLAGLDQAAVLRSSQGDATSTLRSISGAASAFRPAIANWRTKAADLDLVVDVLLELAERAPEHQAP